MAVRYPCEECVEEFNLRIRMSEHIATIHKEIITTSSKQSFSLVSVIWEYGELCDDTAYADVTLARDDEQIHAHKVLVDLVFCTMVENVVNQECIC